MPVVADTSPVLNLAIIGELDLLREQFGEVVVPMGVLAELRPAANLPGSQTIRAAIAAGWLKAMSLQDLHLVHVLQAKLHQSEAEAIALATELGMKAILMDEHDGRAVARSLGLVPTGILGVLLRAKRDGRIFSVRVVIESLRSQAGFRISDSLVRKVLVEAGES